MEKISWTDRVRKVNEQRNIVQTVKREKDNWIGYIWRGNSLLKQVIGGKIEGRITRLGTSGVGTAF